MRRFNDQLTPTVVAKRYSSFMPDPLPLLRFMFVSGCVATAGLILAAYKLGRVVERSSPQNAILVDEKESPDFIKICPMDLGIDYTVPFGPITEQEARAKTERLAMMEKINLRGFKVDSEGYWSKPGGLFDFEEESPKP